MTNVYFALTEEFNAEGVIALLASGQAVVFYRIALMSKDGDWVLRETEEACERVDSARPSVRAAWQGRARDEVVVELAREVDRLQAADRARMGRYEEAARPYLAALRDQSRGEASLEEGHALALRLAERLLPRSVEEKP